MFCFIQTAAGDVYESAIVSWAAASGSRGNMGAASSSGVDYLLPDRVFSKEVPFDYDLPNQVRKLLRQLVNTKLLKICLAHVRSPCEVGKIKIKVQSTKYKVQKSKLY